MTDVSIQAAPMSRSQIEEVAWQVREKLMPSNQPYFHVMKFLEHVLPALYPDFTYEILEDREMGAAEGMNCLGFPKIILPQSVYDAACQNEGRARFTVAHEFGHLILHPKHRLSLSRSASEVKPYRNPEWQANQFAAGILMPEVLVRKYSSVVEIVDAFGVSTQAAELRMKNLGI